MAERYLILSPALLLLQIYVCSNFDSLLFIMMFVTITPGLSLATYLSLTFKRFKQGITIKLVLQLQ